MANPPGRNPWDLPPRELPPIPKSRVPVGYRRGLQLGERFTGLLLVLVGILGLLSVVFIGQMRPPPGAPAPPAGPPGLVVQPISNLTVCLLPMVTLGSLGLIVVGARQLLDP